MTYKIMISSGKDFVIFEASSPVSEGRTANYQQNDITHLPTDIWAYKNTTSRHFNITGKLVCRTASEASVNSHYVDLIRSWTQPDFGNTGATPPILKFSAFLNKNMQNIPCILKSYSMSWPDDVDWIYVNADGTKLSDPMPVITTISVDLEEAYSPRQIKNKEWKTKFAKNDGFFIYGPGKDGAQHSTPDLATLTKESNFQGIASADNFPNSAILGNSKVPNQTIPSSPVVLPKQQPIPSNDAFNKNNNKTINQPIKI